MCSSVVKSYLSERNQFGSINECKSDLLTSIYSVPQGSVLDPLLFLIYINDLPNVTKKLQFYIFADDTNIYCESNTLESLAKTVNCELTILEKWLDTNKHH